MREAGSAALLLGLELGTKASEELDTSLAGVERPPLFAASLKCSNPLARPIIRVFGRGREKVA
jgi:hypothetical protein